jgi:hypothetical protein
LRTKEVGVVGDLSWLRTLCKRNVFKFFLLISSVNHVNVKGQVQANDVLMWDFVFPA